jgi:uncharacterized protein (DUF1778 family)
MERVSDPPKNRPRLTVELFPGEEELVREVRAYAIRRGQSLRDFVLDAVRAKLEREQGRASG